MIRSKEAEAINILANECLIVLEELKYLNADVVQIKREKLKQMATGYLHLYSNAIDSNILPKTKHNNYIH